jgi:hypothetical protein
MAYGLMATDAGDVCAVLACAANALHDLRVALETCRLRHIEIALRDLYLVGEVTAREGQ